MLWGGYHPWIGGCSVHWRDIIRALGVVQASWGYHPCIGWILSVHWGGEGGGGSVQCVELNTLQCTDDIPPVH